MSVVDTFFDTSVLLYLLSRDSGKADRVEQLLEEGGTAIIQCTTMVSDAGGDGA